MPKPALNGVAYLPELAMRYGAGPDGIRELLPALLGAGTLACDIETYGLGADGRRLKCVALASQDTSLVFDPRVPEQAGILFSVMEYHVRNLVFHTSAFDVPNMYLNNLLRKVSVRKVTDIVIYARLAFPDMLVRKSLEALAKRFLRLDQEETIKVAFKRLGWTIRDGYRRMDIDSPLYLMGNAVDAVITARLLEPVQSAALATLTTNHPFTTFGVSGDEALRLLEREQTINRMLLRRSCSGIRVDFDYLDRYRQDTLSRRSEAESVLEQAGVRPGNANDLVKAITLPADWPSTKTGRPSTEAKYLEQLSDPVARAFLEQKRIVKVDDDYLGKCVDQAVNGRIHPRVNLLVATTGRMSYGDPPLQQFSAPARGILLADDQDALTSLDWAQIEPVITANVAGQLSVLRGYEDGTSDLYTDIAEFANIIRKTAKITLLAQLYGEGLGKLGRDLNIDIDAARAIRDRIFGTMPKVKTLLYKLREIGEAYRQVFTLSGRILTVPMGMYDGYASVATHKAVNYFVQGSAYDLLAEAAVRIDEAGLGDALYILMHDEVVCSTEAAHDIRKIMETPPERLNMLAKRVPVLRTDRADLGERWSVA